MLFILVIVGLYLFGFLKPALTFYLRTDLVCLAFIAAAPLLHQIKIRPRRSANTLSFTFEREPFESGSMAWVVLCFGAILAVHVYQMYANPFHVYYLMKVLVFVPPIVHLLLFRKKISYLNDVAFASVLIYFLYEHCEMEMLRSRSLCGGDERPHQVAVWRSGVLRRLVLPREIS